jgi:nicotinamidase-related amidase
MSEKSNNVIRIDAKPEPINVEPLKTAVIVLDMQNDFGSKGGMFDRAGLDISMIQATVRPSSKVLVAARSAGIPIVYLKMGFKPDLSDLGSIDSPNRTRHLHFGVGQRIAAPDGTEGRMLIRDTWNTDIMTELKQPENGDIILYKNRFSGFFETELDDVLKQSRVFTLTRTMYITPTCALPRASSLPSMLPAQLPPLRPKSIPQV